MGPDSTDHLKRSRSHPGFVVIALLMTCVAAAMHAQQQTDPYITGMTVLSVKGCPAFVGAVFSGSPAARAGIRPGDQLRAVDGNPVADAADAARMLKPDDRTSVVVALWREGKEVQLESGYERRSVIYGRTEQKIISGLPVPPDTSQAEVDRMLAFDGRRIEARVFPTHYPDRPELFYGGFEIFILRDPAQITVGGIEKGPASDKGIHWGDVLLSVNGLSVAGKAPPELERLFSATEPATIQVQIDRLGLVKTFDIHLEKASEVARRNDRRIVQGQVVPIWATEADLHCFLK